MIRNNPWIIVVIFVFSDLLWLHPKVIGIHSIVIISYSIVIIMNTFNTRESNRLLDESMELLNKMKVAYLEDEDEV